MHKDVKCRVEGPSDPFGTFANSIRLSLDGAEVLLDFCVFSEETQTARVVCRVRVSADFLRTIHAKIGACFTNPTPDGVVLMPTPSAEPA